MTSSSSNFTPSNEERSMIFEDMMCRLCMNYRGDSLNIFVAKGKGGVEFWSLIEDLLNLEVTEGDGLPYRGCYLCLKKLMDFKEFRDMCVKSAIELQRMYEEVCEKNRVKEEIIIIESDEEETLGDKEQGESCGQDEMCGQDESCGQNETCERSEFQVVCQPLDVGNLSVVKEEANDEESFGCDEGTCRGDGLYETQGIASGGAAHLPPQVFVKEELEPSGSVKEEETCEADMMEEAAFPEKAVYNVVCLPIGMEEQVADFCDVKKELLSPGRNNSEEESTSKFLKIHEDSEALMCYKCGKKFSVESNFEQHLMMHLDNMRFECNGCKKDFCERQYFINHLHMPSGIQRFECHFCEKWFMSKHKLSEHLTLHMDLMKPFKCDTCQIEFAHRNCLVHHLFMHSKRFDCNICGKEFKTRKNLTIHSYVHSDSRPVKCTTCGKHFKSKHHLSSHEYAHNDKLRYKCEICSMGFKWKNALKKHMVRHSGSKPFGCDKCGKYFKLNQDLLDHSIVHCDLKPFTCLACGKTFKRKNALRRHSVQYCTSLSHNDESTG